MVMENKEVLERIENLRGKRTYEEKKAVKLGFSSLYDYFEDKVAKEAKDLDILKESKFASPNKTKKKKSQKEQTSCSCC